MIVLVIGADRLIGRNLFPASIEGGYDVVGTLEPSPPARET